MARRIPTMNALEIARFWSYVVVDTPDKCWHWRPSLTRGGGYGHFKVQGQGYPAHRIAFYLATGQDPADLFVCHKCDVTSCCNPNHLFSGTASDNTQDCLRKGRGNHAAGDRHGSRLHPERFVRGEEHPGSRLTEVQVRYILDRYASGASQRQLANELGVDRQTVGLITRGKHWRHIERIHPSVDPSERRSMKGSRNPAARLTEDQAIEIRQAYKAGESTMSLASRFNVARSTIYHVLQGRTWPTTAD